jgi:hypothetical protein
MDWQFTHMGLYFTTMYRQSITRIHRISALILIAAIAFYLFFQINKRSPFVEDNPFAVDPYDAVGSIAIQVALLISLLTYARVLRWRDDPAQEKGRLVLRGNILVLASIAITLFTDLVAEILQPMPPSMWVNILRLELGLMFLLTFICGLGIWMVFRGIQFTSPPSNLTPADAIDDLWSLARVPVIKGEAVFPPALVDWVKRFNSDMLFARLHWLDPRKHLWHFTAAVGLLVGVLLVLAQLQEGPPPSFGIGLLVTGIFISVELVATLAGFAIFGGYLGLRPAFIPKKQST